MACATATNAEVESVVSAPYSDPRLPPPESKNSAPTEQALVDTADLANPLTTTGNSGSQGSPWLA